MDVATRTWWIVVVFVGGAFLALLAHSRVAALALLVGGFVVAGLAEMLLFRRNRQK